MLTLPRLTKPGKHEAGIANEHCGRYRETSVNVVLGTDTPAYHRDAIVGDLDTVTSFFVRYIRKKTIHEKNVDQRNS